MLGLKAVQVNERVEVGRVYGVMVDGMTSDLDYTQNLRGQTERSLLTSTWNVQIASARIHPSTKETARGSAASADKQKGVGMLHALAAIIC